MLKLYKDQKNSLIKLQKLINVGHNTLYRYVNGERKIENMPIKMLLDIAYVEKIEPEKLLHEIKSYLNKNSYKK